MPPRTTEQALLLSPRRQEGSEAGERAGEGGADLDSCKGSPVLPRNDKKSQHDKLGRNDKVHQVTKKSE